ncbi:MAG: DUF6470 family protein [Clostridiales bacterium]|nr:DUF6470 family protein [Clostridiales bacterium]
MPSIPQINIEQQAARIGITTTRAKVEVVDVPRPKMRIVSEKPRMEIEHKSPAFRLDRQRKRIEVPMPAKSRVVLPTAAARSKTRRLPADASREVSHNPGSDYSGTLVNSGALELNKSINDYTLSANIETIEQNMANIEWEEGYINISWSNAQIQIEWNDENPLPKFSVEPHSVEIFLREKPYIKVKVADEVIAALDAPKVDKKI